ncbi:male sterility protein-domain-containing protein, partial [Schizophyllum commune]
MASSSSSARDAIVAMAAKYSEGLPGYVDSTRSPSSSPVTVLLTGHRPPHRSPSSSPVTVLLTGSTGHLGSEILTLLLTDKRVERVRGVLDGATAGVRDRQRARWADKGLDDELLQSPKLVPLEGDVSEPRFGQSEDVCGEMLASVSVIIHTAWRVNSNHPLDAFESSVKGVRALAGLAGCPHTRSLRFLFTSSTTAARSWEDVSVGDADMTSSPEDVIAGLGYGQSKYVAVRLRAEQVRRRASGIEFASVRIGQS